MKGVCDNSTPRPTAGRRRLFRVLAVVVGLLPFVAFEGLLRLADWEPPTEVEDPFVGFMSVRPLFVPNSDGTRYEIDPARQLYFRPDSFAARKPSDEFRVFCLGGSTVQGRPYAIETSFTTWLELSLQAADPKRQWEVVNCGGISYASYRLVPILRELLAHQPDLFVVYTGHNEFLEDRTYRSVKQTPLPIRRLHAWGMRLRTYRLCRSWWQPSQSRTASSSASQQELPAEVDALLDYRDGLDDYHRDDQWRRGAVAHYRHNLDRMIGLARAARVPLILVNPVSNLRDCPPFKLAISPELDPPRRQQFERAWEAARTFAGSNQQRQLKLTLEALALDDRHAGAYFLLAKCYDGLKRYSEAKAAYIRAKDEDICPLRMIEPLHEALFEVAGAMGTPLVDARALIEEQSQQGIPGNGWLLDHVHPSVNGHQLIADAILEQLRAMKLVQPTPGWRDARERAYKRHLEALPDVYFAHGQQRLEGLIRWTQGRANKLKSGGVAPVTKE